MAPNCELAGLQPHTLKQVVDQMGQTKCALLERNHQAGNLGRFQLGQLVEQQLNGCQLRRQRGSELM